MLARETVFCAGLLLCTVQQGAPRAVDKNAEAEIVRAIAEGYKQNLDSFEFGSGTIRFWEGSVSSLEKALTARPRAPSNAEEYFWTFVGPKTRYEVTPACRKGGGAPPFKTKVKSGEIGVMYTEAEPRGHVSIARNSGGIMLTAFGRVGALKSEDMYFHLSFLLDEPEGHFKNIKARCTARYEGPQVVRGKSLQVVATFYDDKICNRFWVDPDQGYLPLQWFSYCQGCTDNRGDDGKVAAVHAILDIKECSGKRFIPTRAVYVQTEPDRGDGPYWLRYMQLVEFDAEKRPAPETFRLKVPFGTSISNGLSGVHYRANEPEYTDIDPDNLPEVTHEMADVTLSATLPPPTSSSFRMVWIAGVVLLNAIGVGLLGTWVYRNFVSRSAAGRR